MLLTWTHHPSFIWHYDCILNNLNCSHLLLYCRYIIASEPQSQTKYMPPSRCIRPSNTSSIISSSYTINRCSSSYRPSNYNNNNYTNSISSTSSSYNNNNNYNNNKLLLDRDSYKRLVLCLPKYSDSLTPNHTFSKLRLSQVTC